MAASLGYARRRRHRFSSTDVLAGCCLLIEPMGEVQVRIVLATCRAKPALTPSDCLLAAALEKADATVVAVPSGKRTDTK
jgi:hypothetical protein